MRTLSNGLLGAGLVVMWSSGFIGAELGTRYAPTSTLLAWRFLVVAGGLVAWTLYRGSLISRRDVASHAAIGLLAQVGYLYGVVAAAEHGVDAGTSALIAALQPMVGLAVAVPLLRERASTTRLAGVVLGLAGVAIVVGGDLRGEAPAPLWAYALPFAAMLSLVAATVAERRIRPAADLLDGLTVQCSVSAIGFTGLAVANGTLSPPVEPGFWVSVGWVVALSTLGGYGLYWATLARTDVARVSGLLYLTPPATAVWAWLMFGQPVTWQAGCGMAVCAAAVLMIHRGRPPAAESAEAVPAGAAEAAEAAEAAGAAGAAGAPERRSAAPWPP